MRSVWRSSAGGPSKAFRPRVGAGGGGGGWGGGGSPFPAGREFLGTRHAREGAAGRGPEARPPPQDLVGAEPDQALVLEGDAAAEGGEIAEDRLEKGRLARPVGPDHADDGAGRDLERHALEDLEPAVARAELSDLEHQASAGSRRRPRSASITAGSRRIVSGAPSAILSPWSMTTSLSQSSITNAMSCSMTRK